MGRHDGGGSSLSVGHHVLQAGLQHGDAAAGADVVYQLLEPSAGGRVILQRRRSGRQGGGAIAEEARVFSGEGRRDSP